MSTKLCERCKRRIKAEAVSCICGWSLASSRPVMPERLPDPLPSWEESKAAFESVRGRFAKALEPRVWTREKFVDHYRAILDNPNASTIAKRHATEAMKNLGARSVRREPGQDDEELAA